MKIKFYVVTSIPYASGNPHMGHTLDPLFGDVIVRYKKSKGEDATLQVGIDENGQKVLQKASSESLDINTWLSKIEGVYQDFEKKLNIDYKIYTKTADVINHFPACQEMWRRAKANGDIYKKEYKGLYCVGCEAFLNKEDLVDGLCPDHLKAPELIEEENYFFALSKYREFLKDHFDKNPDFVQPKNYFNEAYNLIDQLEDVSISRPKERLSWGVPVPDDENHVIYVWFDALINYLSGIGFPGDMEKFNQYWPADVEIIGKDNNRWHSLLWPAMLKSAGLEIPKVILIHSHITAKGGVKMSKTIGNVIEPIDLLEKYGTDPVRYYLLKLPLDRDGAIDTELFESIYNADLANGLGNILQRTLSMINRYQVKVGDSAPNSSTLIESVGNKIESFKFDQALESIWKEIGVLNEKIENKKPWELAKSDFDELENFLSYLYSSLQTIAHVLAPFMPETAEKMQKQLSNLKPEPLFPRLEK